MTSASRRAFLDWTAALESRHGEALTFAELRRGVQAVSTWYVEERRPGRALDGAAKRAAFAAYFAPLHFLAVSEVVGALGGASAPGVRRIVDLGCGTGPAGAAWALALPSPPDVLGIERNAWAAAEARWSYGRLGVRGRARRADLSRGSLRASPELAFVAAYALNELGASAREPLLRDLLAAAGRGARVLVVEPLARTGLPWWDDCAKAFRKAGGRADEWRFEVDLPPFLARLDRAAGLDHRRLGVRSASVGSC